jgi:hypothetical protein
LDHVASLIYKPADCRVGREIPGRSRWLTSAYWFGLFFSSGLVLVL